MQTKLTQDAVEDARARLARDPDLSIRKLAPELGVNESTLRRRINEARRNDGLSHNVEEHEEVPVIRRDYSHLEELYVYPLGDVHLGADSHQEKRWAEWLDYLSATPDASMLGLGDFLNTAIIGSKSDVYTERMTVQDAKWRLIEQLERLAEQDRLDALTEGNHERRVGRVTGEEPILDVARVLGVPYFPAAAFIVYQVGDVEYTVYTRHGEGNGQNVGQLAKSAMVAEADVYITGHIHQIAATADEYFVVQDGRARRRRRYYVSSGAFLGYERYAAVRGYKPTRLGAPRIHLNGRDHDVHVSI